MTSFAAGARRLPHHHITIRVPWHDGGWTGSVCARPLDNSICLILPRIGEGRRSRGRVDCEVIAPALAPRKPGERVKTDRRDVGAAATESPPSSTGRPWPISAYR